MLKLNINCTIIYNFFLNVLEEYPSAPYDELLRSAGVEGLSPCAEPIKLPGDPCRPNQKPIAFRPRVISNTKKEGGGEEGGEGGGKSCGTFH